MPGLYVGKNQMGKLNSMTKYPAILTYHTMGERGILQDEVQVPFAGEVVLSEKIDGTNTRVIVFPDKDFVIGSREELLYARGDRVPNEALGITGAVMDHAYGLADSHPGDNVIRVFFMETYGGNIGPWKQYTRVKATGVNVFDIQEIPVIQFEDMLSWEREDIASWRDHGGQRFLPWDHIPTHIVLTDLKRAPYLGIVDEMPKDIEDSLDFMNNWFEMDDSGYRLTYANLDVRGRAEGIVARSFDRSAIAKLRFQDYQKTCGRR